MVPLQFSLGPSDDWDPQGYDEEEEDTLVPGMHEVDEADEDKIDDDAVVEEVAIDEDLAVEEDEEAEDEDLTGLEDLDKDPIKELDELENRVLETERATLRLSDFSDEE